MKSAILTRITAVTLFGALPIPVQLAAQGQKEAESKHPRYKLVDIGTFGGPESYVNAAFSLGSPNQINNRGTVVGAAATRIPTPPNKQICGGPDGLVPFVFHAFEWQNGVPTDLGALPGIECSQAVSVNASGEVVGGSGNGVTDPLAGGIEEVRAVLWKDGEIQDLGTLGGSESTAVAINNRGQVTGFSTNAIPDPFSLLYFPAGITNGTQTRAFLWHKGLMEDLHTLGGPDAQAFGLNERGQVIGISYINSTPNPSTGVPTADPFLWSENRGMIDLGTLGGTSGGPNALNNRGQVIGVSNLAGDQISHPFLWDDGKLIDLNTDTIGGNPLIANAINDAGEVVGGAAFPNRPFDAYLWKNGVATDLGTLPGDCFSQAFAINARGQIVGQSIACDFSSRSFLWENGSMIDLNNFVPPGSDVQLDNTVAINDRGEIAPEGLPPSCKGVPQGNDTLCGHAFVLIPCDGANVDAEGCKDGGDATADVSQNNATSVSQGPAAATQGSPVVMEMMARVRAQLAHRFHVPGLATAPAR